MAGTARRDQGRQQTKTALTPERLREVLLYDPETGLFTWRRRAFVRPAHWNDKFAGKLAGRLSNKGYWQIKIDNVAYSAHRLAWMYIYGLMPEEVIDHIDGDPINNAIANLREASWQQNARNRAIEFNKPLRKKGVVRERNGRYRATIYVDGRLLSLGVYDSADLAHQAYCEAAKKHFGDFWNAG